MIEMTPQSARRAEFGPIPVILLAVALIALAAFGIDRALTLRDNSSADDSRTAALVAARSEVVTLLSISPSTSSSDIARLLDGATSSFRADFKSRADALQKAVKDAKVTSKGSVASSGISTLTGDKAVVLIAASGTVENLNTTKPEARNYRLRVSLDKVGGRWLVSGMDFVA